MTKLTKKLAPAGVALAAMAALSAPMAAQAQNKVAMVDVPRAILTTSSFQTAYNQVATTYAAQLASVRTKQDQFQNLATKFDKNGDGQIDQAENTAFQTSPDFAQAQTLQSEIATLTGQVNGARVYVVEQFLAQYAVALREVVTAQGVSLVLLPEAVQYANDSANLTDAVSASLNAKVGNVNGVPPAEWRPSRQGAQVLQEIQQIIAISQMQQQAAQQPAAPAVPQGR